MISMACGSVRMRVGVSPLLGTRPKVIPQPQYLRHLSREPTFVLRTRSTNTGSPGFFLRALSGVSSCVPPLAMTCLF
jgi:hypothetical protein